MNRLTLLCLLTGSAIVSCSAAAQDFKKPAPSGYPPFSILFEQRFEFVLNRDEVLKEVKITPEQHRQINVAMRKLEAKYDADVEKLRSLPEKDREARHEKIRTEYLPQSDQVVKDVLSPEQLKRFKQLVLQRRGPKAFDDPEVQKSLRLTEEQKKKRAAVAEEMEREAGRVLRTQGLTARAAFELDARHVDKVLALLTPDQKQAWKELTGEPFRFTLPGR